MGFREEFAKLPAGQAREDLVFRYAIKQGPPKTVPVTVDGPSGTKIIYQVMPDYVTIEGIRAPMTAATAQRIANHFNMHLPNAALTKEIYNAAKAKGGAVSAKPLSGIGAKVPVIDPATGKPKIDPATGKVMMKSYSGEDVVRSGVNKTEFSLAYNDLINKDPAMKNQDPNNPTLVAGHFKDILAPIPGHEDRMALHGMYDASGKPIQGGNGLTPHDTQAHSEYGTGARLVSDNVTIVYPDGRKVTTNSAAIKNKPALSKALIYVPGAQQYNAPGGAPAKKPSVTTKTDKPESKTPAVSAPKPSAPAQPPGKVDSLVERINKFLDSIMR